MVAPVQNVRGTATAGASSISATLGKAPVNGNFLVIAVTLLSASAINVTSITQTGASWVRAYLTAGTFDVEIWYTTSVNGATTGITVNLSGSITTYGAVINVLEFSGMGVAQQDQVGKATGSSTPASTGTTPVTTSPIELLFGAILAGTAASLTLTSPTNGFTLYDGTTGPNSICGAALVKISSSTGAASSSLTESSNVTWQGAIVTFIPGVQVLVLTRNPIGF